MKKHIIKYIQKYLLLAIVAISVSACKKDIFDKGDLTGVDPNIWSIESAATLYINGTYQLVMPNWPLPGAMHNTSDETNSSTDAILYGLLDAAGNGVTDIASGNTNSTNQYFNIRRINLAIQGLEAGSLDAATKAKLKGQMYFFRAYIYFNLVKLYGGVPLVLKSQDLGSDTLLVPRSKTSVCIKQITADLDSCYGLPSKWTLSTDGGRITSDVALAFKAKVLMYWASPQFNPTDDLARWQTAYTAAKTAYNTALADGYDLFTFANIFTDESTSNKERMMWRTYDNISIQPGRGTNTENLVRPISETSAGGGAYQPTWNLVQAFPMKDGLAINDPSPVGAGGRLYGYDETVFYLNRDPRFDATIAYNGCVWPLSGKGGRKQWNYVGVGEDASKQSATGFYCRKISNATISATAAKYDSNAGGGSGMDWIEMRFAEVLLNYAECANGAGQLNEAKTVLVKLRTQRGLQAGNFNYGLDKVTDRAGMFTFIRNERFIEFAMEGKRYDDLRRTRGWTALNGTQRLGYRWTPKAPNTVATLESTATSTKPRDLLDITNPTVVNSTFTLAKFSLETTTSGYTVINFPDNYYFYPLPTNFRNSSVVIEQTTGWPNGTFNPLL